MMITALALAALIAVQPQTAARSLDETPERIRQGCGYVAGTDHLFPIEVGVFFDGDPPFQDQYGQSVRVNGRWTHPDTSPYTLAPMAPWLRDNLPITVAGREYVKYGLPRVYGIEELEWCAELGGLAVAAEPGVADPEVVYVLVQPAECGFQPYQRKV